jgi:hypothetical protein
LPETVPDVDQAGHEALLSTLTADDHQTLANTAVNLEDKLREAVRSARVSCVGAEVSEHVKQTRREWRKTSTSKYTKNTGSAAAEVKDFIVERCAYWELPVRKDDLGPVVEAALRVGAASRQGRVAAALAPLVPIGARGARTFAGIASALGGKQQNAGKLSDPRQARGFLFHEAGPREQLLFALSVILPGADESTLTRCADAVVKSISPSEPEVDPTRPTTVDAQSCKALADGRSC